jgi:hypothetical protein
VVERVPHEAETRRQLLGQERLLLGHQAPLTVCGPGGEALGDDVGDAGRLGGGQQVVRPLRAQPDGLGAEPLWVPEVRLARVREGECGHLVHDRVRPGLGHRLTDRRRIQPVHHDALGTELLH